MPRIDEGDATGKPVPAPAPEAVNLDLSLQPIVSLKDGKPRHYMARADICMAAQDRERADTFSDTLKIAEVIALASHLGEATPEARIFCGISPGTLEDESFRRDLVEVLSKVPELAERLVFEVDAEMAALTNPAATDLAALVKLGFALCVRLNAAEQVHENFVGTLRKLTAHRMLMLTKGGVLAQRRCGITLIATDIVTESVVSGLSQLGVSLGEGEIFGAARTIRRPSLTKLAA
ncbi:EAL domain-containing protein [Pacificimonas sp. WHA3]|uniref:EAL domain-containing protein n=1 Tax=Pacificimonas pallii TaxID=2827236 RepID=A0ABS6SA07_9SPHN|nr:EAL domain-containing protein [Pacificimonas pallii]MBV7255193.1 EAL domain-containing protein [Pacificimonas pallii]